MNDFFYLRPRSLPEAVDWLSEHAHASLLAGGQSLLAAMRLGLNAPSHLIDLQDVPGLADISRQDDTLLVGALVSHARMASSAMVKTFCPMLAELAQGIADAQVRELGTIGGSLCNHDPAACWPAGVLAANATLVTDRREIPADDFFTGLYRTVLSPNEIVCAIRFRRPLAARYEKFEQAASRFALVGVAVARFFINGVYTVRVAVTGLGLGVTRWTRSEQALGADWHPAALDGFVFPAAAATGDIHAGAAYRAHLVAVMTRRIVASLTVLPLHAG